MRHSIDYKYQARGVTPRRLAAAKRALRLERERMPILSNQIADEQPTPEQRIDHIDQQALQAFQSHRELTAKHWRSGRNALQENPEHAADILEQWNRSSIPPHAHYFADFVRGRLKQLGIHFPGDPPTA